MDLSAIVICKNEEKNIQRCLESLSWLSEVVIVDGFSTDKTCQIINSFKNTKLISSQWLGYSDTKTLAISHCTNPWILWVDADEEVSKELKSEVSKLFTQNMDQSAYFIKRRNWFMDQEVRYSGWQNDWVPRLFHKEKCYFDGKHVHESLVINGSSIKLKAKINHFTYSSFDEYIKKYNAYNLLSAKDKLDKTGNITLYHLALKPILRFFRHYFLQRGFLDGQLGFILCAMSGISVFFRYVKMRQLKAGKE